MRPALSALAVVLGFAPLALLTSCDDHADPPAPALLGVAGSEPDAGAVDPALCAGLDECSCAQTAACVPLITDCYCPPAACGASDGCPCSGGRYLGCNPRRGGCATGHCALFGEPSLRDQRGCIACVDPGDCSTAISELPALCPGMNAADAQWICSGAYDPCASFCVNTLRTCDGASCALSAYSTCDNDLFDSCLYECLSVAQNRH
jgi:hypothetical protein